MKKIILITLLYILSKSVFAINVPTHVSPTNGITDQYPNITIDINAVTGATNYDFEVDINSDFSTAVLYTSTSSQYSLTELYFGQKYYWRSRARNATETSDWSAAWNFTVTDNTYLTTPTNGATGQDVNVLIDWYYVTGATIYIYQLDTTASFNSAALISATISSSSSQAYTNELYFGKKYYWRVRSAHSKDTTQWSSTWNFTTTDFSYLYTPSNNATGQDVNVLLDWYTTYGVTNYIYQVDTTLNFNSPLLINNTMSSSSSQIYMNELRFGTKYFWRVKAFHSKDTTQWSSTWNFTTTDYVSLYTPSNNSTGQDVNVLLDWYTTYGVTNYIYQVDTTLNFNSPLLINNTMNSSSSQIYMNELRFGKKYYWRVKAFHSKDTTQWSSTWNFTTTDYVSLYTPSNNSTGQDVNVLLDWYTTYGVTNYIYQVDTTLNFNSPLLINNTMNSSSSQIYMNELRFGTKYYWRVKAFHSKDTTQWSSTWNFTTTDFVSLYTPSNNSTGQDVNVLLDWHTTYGVTNYIYQVDTTLSFNSPLLINSTISSSSSSVYMNELQFGTKYFWRVKAFHSKDTTQWSSIWNFTTTDYVSLYTPSNNALNVAINPTLDWYITYGITNYIYQYSANPDFSGSTPVTISSSSSQATISGLEYGEKYYWRVKAFHSKDTTQWSSVWNFTTVFQLANAPVLQTPANLTQNIIDDIYFSWTSSTGATSYQVQFDTENTFSSPENYTTENLNITYWDFNFGTTYYWRVRGTNTTGNSPWSTTWSFTTQSIIPPTLISPTNNAINQNYNLTLDWLDILNITEYMYQYSTDNTFTTFIEGTTTNSYLDITNLQMNTQYFWRVKSNIQTNISDWSETWNFTTKNILPPVLVSPSDNSTNQFTSLTLDWNDVSGITNYLVQLSTNEEFSTPIEFEPATSSQSINYLLYETEYFWRVKSVIDENQSEWSSIWSFTTKTLPVFPSLISPADNSINQETDIAFDWSNVTNIQNYEIQVSEFENFSSYISSVVTNSDETINNLQNYTLYYWRVRTSDGTEYSEWSNVWSFTTKLETPVLASPSNGATNVNFENIQLICNTVDAATNYEFKYSDDENLLSNVTTVNSENPQILIANLQELTQYYWKVKASYDVYESNWSDVWNFTTRAIMEINKIENTGLFIYPNPASDFINIYSKNEIKTVEIYDITGKTVYNSNTLTENIIDVKNLNSGIYFIRINNSSSTKFIKE